jgi:fructan beta-fructosidase
LNPVLPFKASIYLSNGKTNKTKKYVFRDPKVIFHAASASWVFVLSGGDHILFYRSVDLINWSLISRFGYEDGSHGGTWECPDLIEFPQTKTNRSVNLWILIVSVQNSAPAGGSGMQYFIGTFDGSSFENLQSPQTVNWFDYGPDFYAGITFHNVPRYDGRQVLISWMNNWQYAREVPTAPSWRGHMSIPRQLKLDFNSFTNAYHLRQLPVRELYSYAKRLFTYQRQTLTSRTPNILSTVAARIFVIVAEFHDVTRATIIRFRVRQSLDRMEYTQIKYMGQKNRIDVDRSHSGRIDFHRDFCTHFNTTLDNETTKTGILKLQLVVDRSSVEVFVNDGKYTLTSLIFPTYESNQIELAVDGQLTLNYLELMFI